MNLYHKIICGILGHKWVAIKRNVNVSKPSIQIRIETVTFIACKRCGYHDPNSAVTYSATKATHMVNL